MLLNKHNLKIERFASEEKSRHTINAVCVTKKCTVATDGHLLVAVTLPDRGDSAFPHLPGFETSPNPDEPILLKRKTSKAIVSSIPRSENLPILEHACVSHVDGKTRVATTDLEVSRIFVGCEESGTFPQWECALPSGPAKFEIAVNPSLLAEIAKFAGEFVGGTGVMRIQFFAADKPLRFDAENIFTEQGMTAALMPMRCSSTFPKGIEAKKSMTKAEEVLNPDAVPVA